jgi:short-subunit dehydrogenase
MLSVMVDRGSGGLLLMTSLASTMSVSYYAIYRRVDDGRAVLP